ncbi:MAG TPA: hypothetical protein DD713_01755 [Nitrospiraceae bacterium]|nr:hypothetical protein [Nitrospiraceae bacterium]
MWTISRAAPYAFWNYTFFHELGHCWISIKYGDLRTEEIFTDLVAISALRELIRPHEKLFKETVKLRSYRQQTGEGIFWQGAEKSHEGTGAISEKALEKSD